MKTHTSHTPGPWTAVANRPDEDNGKLDRVKAPSGSNVAFIPAYEHDCEEENANARLIAAAPDLLAALLEIETRWDRGDFSRETKVWMQMRDAITKALGN